MAMHPENKRVLIMFLFIFAIQFVALVALYVSSIEVPIKVFGTGLIILVILLKNDLEESIGFEAKNVRSLIRLNYLATVLGKRKDETEAQGELSLLDDHSLKDSDSLLLGVSGYLVTVVLVIPAAALLAARFIR